MFLFIDREILSLLGSLHIASLERKEGERTDEGQSGAVNEWVRTEGGNDEQGK